MLVLFDSEVATADLLDPILSTGPWWDFLDVLGIKSADAYLGDEVLE